MVKEYFRHSGVYVLFVKLNELSRTIEVLEDVYLPEVFLRSPMVSSDGVVGFSPFFVVGTHLDMVPKEERRFVLNDFKVFADKYRAERVYVSLKTGENYDVLVRMFLDTLSFWVEWIWK